MRDWSERWTLVAVLVLCAATCAPQPTAQGGELYVFGDSLSDNGNLFTFVGGTSSPIFSPDPADSPRLPTPPYYAGRATNGPVWVESLAGKLGLASPQPWISGGTNYSFIAAVTGAGSSSPYPIPTITGQVDIFLRDSIAVAPDDLFVVWGGANDFFYGQTDWTVPVSNLVNAIEQLHDQAGASRFLIPNLPPLGRTPTGALLDADQYDFLSEQFNVLLSTELATLRDSLGVTVYEFDVYDQFEQMLADPAAYGLTNVTQPSLVLNEDPSSELFGYPTYPYTLQYDPDESLFFDGVHPTALGHELLARAAARAVPEPGALALMLAGIGLLTLLSITTRRRRAAGICEPC